MSSIVIVLIVLILIIAVLIILANNFVNILPKLRYIEGRNYIQMELEELFSTFVFPTGL